MVSLPYLTDARPRTANRGGEDDQVSGTPQDETSVAADSVFGYFALICFGQPIGKSLERGNKKCDY
jgi:hypothetical protein